MSTLVIKNLPEPLHELLRTQAVKHHRSITKEAIALLEQGLVSTKRTAMPLPPPIKLKGGPVTTEWILAAISEGRE